MDGIYLVYFLLGALLFGGAKLCAKGEWNGEYTSLRQTNMLRGAAALGVVLHHTAQKTCAPWLPRMQIRQGLNPFLNIGFLFVGIFFFLSGFGLYKSLRQKQDYLKGFLKRRVLPMVIVYYLSEFIYLAVRLLMGERMSTAAVLWNLTGLRTANSNAWYMVVIVLFYVLFYLAFRFCRKEGTAILLVTLGVLLYTAVCLPVDHQSTWWIRGEWWYNTVMLFPLGLLFGKYEGKLTALFKKRYPLCLGLSAAAFPAAYVFSRFVTESWAGYYGEEWGDRLKILHRAESAGAQWLACALLVFLILLVLLKCRWGNPVLSFFGWLSLDLYLMHGLFVELLGYSFLDKAKSLYYIRNVPLYLLAVLACAVLAGLLFRLIRKADLRKLRLRERLKGLTDKRRLRVVLILALLSAAYLLLPRLTRVDPLHRRVNGLELDVPAGYACTYSDSRYSVWEYGGKDKKPGKLILDAEIRGNYAQSFQTADEVLAHCDWMREAELYVNPHGIRMARGFAGDTEDSLERRYYVEGGSAVFLIVMNENAQYSSPEDCETMILAAADTVRLPGK